MMAFSSTKNMSSGASSLRLRSLPVSPLDVYGMQSV